jgi:hypothetical protein
MRRAFSPVERQFGDGRTFPRFSLQSSAGYLQPSPTCARVISGHDRSRRAIRGTNYSRGAMTVDLLLPAGEKIVLVLEGIGDDKIRVNSLSLDHPLTILPDQGIEIVGIQKKVTVGRTARLAYWLNHDPSRMVEAGYGPATR